MFFHPSTSGILQRISIEKEEKTSIKYRKEGTRHGQRGAGENGNSILMCRRKEKGVICQRGGEMKLDKEKNNKEEIPVSRS